MHPPPTKRGIMSIFMQSTTGLNKEFSFFYISCLTNFKESSLSYYSSIIRSGYEINKFLPFSLTVTATLPLRIFDYNFLFSESKDIGILSLFLIKTMKMLITVYCIIT